MKPIKSITVLLGTFVLLLSLNLNAAVENFNFEEEAYINDIPFSTECVTAEYLYEKAVNENYDFKEETYIADIGVAYQELEEESDIYINIIEEGTGEVVAEPAIDEEKLKLVLDIESTNIEDGTTFGNKSAYGIEFDNLPSGIRKSLLGLKVGTKLELVIAFKEAYGNATYNEEFISTEIPAYTNMKFVISIVNQEII